MLILQIVLGLVAVILLAAWWWWQRRSVTPAKAEEDRIDTLTGWPPQATRVLTTRERLAFGTLVQALPEYMILAQVPLARFLSVPKRNSYADWLRRLGYQCVDFAVCDMAAQVIAVVELQPAGGLPSESARKRAKRMARTLKAAGIPLLVWPEASLPSVAVAREALLPKAAPVVTTAATPKPTPAVAATPVTAAAKGRFNPFDDTGRDSTQDEKIELLEPPPSTWFDDLDSGPADLHKH